MKKTALMIIVVILAMVFTSCTGSMGEVNNKQPVQATEKTADTPKATPKEATPKNTATATPETTPEATPEATVTSLAEQVIYDRNDILVTATGLKFDGWMGPEVTVLVENNSTENITIQAQNSSVNGVMADTIFSVDVAAGKKANDSITLSGRDLELAGVDTLKEIELELKIINGDSWEKIDVTGSIKLRTSVEDSYTQVLDDSGMEVHNYDGIRVVLKKLNSSDSFWGSELYLYAENNTEQNITIQVRDVSVNGFMVDPMFSCDIVAGKKAFDSITFMESDLEENNVADIEEMEFKFHIFESETWDTIHDTAAIKVEFE